jgi:hypothetical protein
LLQPDLEHRLPHFDPAASRQGRLFVCSDLLTVHTDAVGAVQIADEVTASGNAELELRMLSRNVVVWQVQLVKLLRKGGRRDLHAPDECARGIDLKLHPPEWTLDRL